MDVSEIGVWESRENSYITPISFERKSFSNREPIVTYTVTPVHWVTPKAPAPRFAKIDSPALRFAQSCDATIYYGQDYHGGKVFSGQHLVRGPTWNPFIVAKWFGASTMAWLLGWRCVALEPAAFINPLNSMAVMPICVSTRSP